MRDRSKIAPKIDPVSHGGHGGHGAIEQLIKSTPCPPWPPCETFSLGQIAQSSAGAGAGQATRRFADPFPSVADPPTRRFADPFLPSSGFIGCALLPIAV